MIIQKNLKQLFNKVVEIAKAKYSKDFYFKIKEFKNISITSEGLIELRFITLDNDDEMENEVITISPEELKDSDIYLPLYEDKALEKHIFKSVYDRYKENRIKIINQFVKEEVNNFYEKGFQIEFLDLLHKISVVLDKEYESKIDEAYELGEHIEDSEKEYAKNSNPAIKVSIDLLEKDYEKVQNELTLMEQENSLFIDNLLSIIRNTENSYVVEFLKNKYIQLNK